MYCVCRVRMVGRAEFKQNFALSQLLNIMWKKEHYIKLQTKYFGSSSKTILISDHKNIQMNLKQYVTLCSIVDRALR